MPASDQKGAAALNAGADQMWIWDATNGAWVKYFWRKQGATTIGWCKQGTTVVTADTVSSGQGVFFKRANTGLATTLTVSGQVAPLTSSQTIEVPAAATIIAANPWPTPFAVADLANCIPVADQKGAAALNAGADQIWVWENNAWTKYFFRKQGTTVVGWCQQGTTAVTSRTLDPGQGFFFKRANTGGATTITFPAPSAD